MGNYNLTYTPTFKDQISEISEKLRKQIESKTDDLISDPWHNTEFLKGKYRGKRKLWLNQKDRLIFVICEECREFQHFKYNQCSDCDTTPENNVVIAYLILGHDY